MRTRRPTTTTRRGVVVTENVIKEQTTDMVIKMGTAQVKCLKILIIKLSTTPNQPNHAKVAWWKKYCLRINLYT